MKKYNLTDKMSFNVNPTIVINDTELTVKSDAKTMLKLVELSENAKDDYTATIKGYELIFSEEDRAKIDKLELSASDFVLLIQTAVALASGQDPDEKQGEE